MSKPKKWTEVYPQGSKAGDEEQRFFIALARNPKYKWRSTSAIAKESGLAKERVEEIIAKYYKRGMVIQNPKNEDQWGYWERVPEMVENKTASLSSSDKKKRIDSACNSQRGTQGGVGGDSANPFRRKTANSAKTVACMDDGNCEPVTKEGNFLDRWVAMVVNPTM